MRGSFLGVRCRANIDCHELCRNPKCECACHDKDEKRAEELRSAKSKGRRRGERRSVYHMDNVDAGELYEFEL